MGERKPAARKLPSIAVRKACFIEVLRRTANVSRAAREAGLSSSTVRGIAGLRDHGSRHHGEMR